MNLEFLGKVDFDAVCMNYMCLSGDLEDGLLEKIGEFLESKGLVVELDYYLCSNLPKEKE